MNKHTQCISFVVLCGYIVMSIFVAIVLVNFTDEVLGQSLAEFADEESWRSKERLVLRILILFQKRWRASPQKKRRLQPFVTTLCWAAYHFLAAASQGHMATNDV